MVCGSLVFAVIWGALSRICQGVFDDYDATSVVNDELSQRNRVTPKLLCGIPNTVITKNMFYALKKFGIKKKHFLYSKKSNRRPEARSTGQMEITCDVSALL